MRSLNDLIRDMPPVVGNNPAYQQTPALRSQNSPYPLLPQQGGYY